MQEQKLKPVDQLSPQGEACLKIINHVKNSVSGGDVSAVSLAVTPGFDNNTVTNVYCGANSNLIGAPITNADTVYGIGSITKSFVSVILIKLASAGLLSLDAQLQTILPQYSDTAWGTVTVRQLLNMTSGIVDYLNDPYCIMATLQKNLALEWTPTDIINAFIKQYQYLTSFTPNEGWLYSNLGYLILSQLIEFLTKNSLETNLNNLCASLNLNIVYKPNVLLNIPNSPFTNVLAHYYYDNMDYSYEISQSFYSGAGGLVSTIDSVLKWSEMLFDGNVLTPEQLQEMQQLVSYQTGQPIDDVTPEDPYGYGLGIAKMYVPTYGPCWWYQGNIEGATAFYYRVPTANMGMVTVALAANSAENNVPMSSTVILRQILQVMGAQPVSNFKSEIASVARTPFAAKQSPHKAVGKKIPAADKLADNKKSIDPFSTSTGVSAKNTAINSVVTTPNNSAKAQEKSEPQLSLTRSIYGLWSNTVRTVSEVICGCDPSFDAVSNKNDNPYRIIKSQK